MCSESDTPTAVLLIMAVQFLVNVVRQNSNVYIKSLLHLHQRHGIIS